MLRLDEPAPMRDLAESLSCDRSYITSLADELEERGLITRVTGTDRRVKLLALTPKGRAVRDEMAAVVAENSLILRRLDGPQRKALEPLLERLLDEPSPTNGGRTERRH